ncbi:hypothetical protein BpHYR1_032235 [Brachionus plicatilis]|uniref:Uncharacterized protein n=1 Tax=Brachionus plicatilis TaxID=10195 RepID=A0A3M7T9D1_BRAPC|nr:hypothetical protein BpHYR1_032235 [Brachionus plicatilis]
MTDSTLLSAKLTFMFWHWRMKVEVCGSRTGCWPNRQKLLSPRTCFKQFMSSALASDLGKTNFLMKLNIWFSCARIECVALSSI